MVIDTVQCVFQLPASILNPTAIHLLQVFGIVLVAAFFREAAFRKDKDK
jgi:hypothetical protein